MTMETARKIDLLLVKLAAANKQQGSRSNEGRNIRKELRALGHRGGLQGTRES